LNIVLGNGEWTVVPSITPNGPALAFFRHGPKEPGMAAVPEGQPHVLIAFANQKSIEGFDQAFSDVIKLGMKNESTV